MPSGGAVGEEADMEEAVRVVGPVWVVGPVTAGEGPATEAGPVTEAE